MPTIELPPSHLAGDIRFQTTHGLDHLLATLDMWHAAAREAVRKEMEGKTAHAGSLRVGVQNYEVGNAQ